MDYRAEFRLKRKGSGFIYECPDFKKIFDGWQRYERKLIFIASPRHYEDDDPEVEVIWEFESNLESCERLRAYKVMFGKDLEIKIEECGTLILKIEEPPYLKVVIYLDSHKSVKDVISRVLYILNREEVELIIWQAIDYLQDKIGELEEGGWTNDDAND